MSHLILVNDDKCKLQMFFSGKSLSENFKIIKKLILTTLAHNEFFKEFCDICDITINHHFQFGRDIL